MKGKNPDKPNPNIKPKSDYDYDFTGIIETEGVIEIMPDGYGFMRSLIIIIYLHLMMFMFHIHK